MDWKQCGEQVGDHNTSLFVGSHKILLVKEIVSLIQVHKWDIIALYSVSTLHWATIFSVLFLQEIIIPPIRTQYLIVERLSIGDHVQSTSQYPKIWVFPLSSYNRI